MHFVYYFPRPDRIADIAALHPDLLILSFGTSKAITIGQYNAALSPMDGLVRVASRKLPDIAVLMTLLRALARVSGSVAVVGPKINPRTAVCRCRPSAAMPMKTDWRYGTMYEIGGTTVPASTGRKPD